MSCSRGSHPQRAFLALAPHRHLPAWGGDLTGSWVLTPGTLTDLSSQLQALVAIKQNICSSFHVSVLYFTSPAQLHAVPAGRRSLAFLEGTKSHLSQKRWYLNAWESPVKEEHCTRTMHRPASDQSSRQILWFWLRLRPFGFGNWRVLLCMVWMDPREDTKGEWKRAIIRAYFYLVKRGKRQIAAEIGSVSKSNQAFLFTQSKAHKLPHSHHKGIKASVFPWSKDDAQ